MSEDHKPDNPKELKRITKAGGTVSDGRVCGCLNLSRALGDF
jgi:serine/threonine protein phosphatase PrpC